MERTFTVVLPTAPSDSYALPGASSISHRIFQQSVDPTKVAACSTAGDWECDALVAKFEERSGDRAHRNSHGCQPRHTLHQRQTPHVVEQNKHEHLTWWTDMTSPLLLSHFRTFKNPGRSVAENSGSRRSWWCGNRGWDLQDRKKLRLGDGN